MTKNQFYGCLIVGFFSWSAQESVTFALSVVKAGTCSAFYNLALLLSFIADHIYFGRRLLYSDYAGCILIVICTLI
jgi:hypothetical protein